MHILFTGGTYKCTSFNAGGEASAELRLIVSTALHVEVSPPLLSVHMGGTAEFKCLVSAPNEGPHLVTWYKDGRQLPNTGRSSSEALVISNVGREDKGMYQCIIRRAEGDTAQASAELQLGGRMVSLFTCLLCNVQHFLKQKQFTVVHVNCYRRY